MRVAILMVLVMASCGGGRLSPGEARAAADAALVEQLPQLDDATLDELHLETIDLDGRWRVTYGGGTGGAVVDVDKRSGEARIVSIEQ